MTQRELGDRVGYSEKSVSKWELGENMPPIGTLSSLATVLGTNVDTLLGFRSSPTFFLGIDGGATKTTFALADIDGNVLRTVTLGPSNAIDIGFDSAKKVLNDGIREICRDIPFGSISLFAGLSGGISGDNPRLLREFFDLFGFSFYDCGSDIENAIATTLADGDGICSIMGTGNITFAVRDGKRTRHGGYGYLFDEGGSAYDIGARAIRAALYAEDGSGEATMLLPLCREALGKSAVDSVGDLYAKGKTYIASFAPLVFRAADDGDKTAKRILRESMNAFACHLRAAMRSFPVGETVDAYVIGGLTKGETTMLPFLKEATADLPALRLHVCHKRPIEGALWLSKNRAEKCQNR